MRGKQLELEGIAQAIRSRAGLRSDEYADITRIATSLVGEGNLIADPSLRGATYLVDLGDKFQILARLDADDLRFRVMHECAHVALRRLAGARLEAHDEERAANYIAAAIMAPAQVVSSAYRQLGEEPVQLAFAFGMSQTAVTMRLAEVLGDERAVVTTGRTRGVRRILVRNAQRVDWAHPRIIAAADAELELPGLAKTRLLGGIDDGRVAFRVK